MSQNLHELVFPFTPYLNVENAPNPAWKHFQKTNKMNISRTWNVLSIIWRSWVRTHVLWKLDHRYLELLKVIICPQCFNRQTDRHRQKRYCHLWCEWYVLYAGFCICHPVVIPPLPPFTIHWCSFTEKHWDKMANRELFILITQHAGVSTQHIGVHYECCLIWGHYGICMNLLIIEHLVD